MRICSQPSILKHWPVVLQLLLIVQEAVPKQLMNRLALLSSLQVTDRKVDEDMKRLKEQTKGRKINLYEEDEPETADIITVNG